MSVVPRGAGQGLAPRGPPRRAPTGFSAPLFPFQKSHQSNQNVTHVRFQERFVPSLMLSPSQHLASLTPPSLQSPLPPGSRLDPRRALCGAGGGAGGAGGSSGCLLHSMEGSTSQRARGHEWSFLTWLRCPVPQCRAPGPGGKALGVLGMVWGGPCTPAPAASLTEVPSRVSQWPPRIQDPNCCPSRWLSPPGSPHGADPPPEVRLTPKPGRQEQEGVQGSSKPGLG